MHVYLPACNHLAALTYGSNRLLSASVIHTLSTSLPHWGTGDAGIRLPPSPPHPPLKVASHCPGLAARSGVKNDSSRWASSLPSPTALGSLWQWEVRQLAQHLLSFLFPVYSRIHEREAWILRGILFLLCTEHNSSSSFELIVMFDNFCSSFSNCFEHYFFFFSFVAITFDSLLLFLVLLCNTTIRELCAQILNDIMYHYT